MLLSEDPASSEALARVRVLYTDLDGTLLAKGGCLLADGDGNPSCEVAETIVAANAAGLTVVPVSGRSRIQLVELVRLLGWTDFIAEAGAVLVRGIGAGSEVEYNFGDWPADILGEGENPYEFIENSGAYEALREAFPGRLEYHDPWHLDREATHLLRGCLDVEAGQAVLDGMEVPVDLIDNGIVRNRGTLACGDDCVPHAYHLVPSAVSKAQAIRLDLAHRGLTCDQAAAIGDSATDIEMADAVAIMALVDNAFESEGVRLALETPGRANVRRTRRARGAGWSEFVSAWLSAVRSR